MSKMKTKGVPSDIDIHVGQRLRVRRSLMGLSQEKLAESTGVTFQQIQKYERGTNRISAGRLYELSNILDVPVTYFFEQISGGSSHSVMPGMSDNAQDSFSHDREDVMSTRETLELVKTYYAIKDPEFRKDVMKFVKSMAEKLS